MTRKPAFVFLAVWAASAFCAPAPSAPSVKPNPLEYPVDWPAGPARSTAPAWAAPGRIRFARWDGGRIETAKAILSGWPGFNPPDPDQVEAMTNWYRPDTVPLLREAGMNMIWVTFSNGFSMETEAAHQAQVRDYIEICHRAGIHVMAYESISNLFWEDMFQRVPESPDWVRLGGDGKPRFYGGGDYAKVGRITRYLADLGKAGWRDILRRRVGLAIDAGADGVMFDNNSGDHLWETYQELYRYGASRKKDFLLMGNFHHNTYVYNRLVNAITTEDAFEPGIYAEVNTARLDQEQKRYYGRSGGFLTAAGGRWVNNVGLYRIHQALSEGWKPVMIENQYREVGRRETNPMSAARQKLAMAECRMFGISMEAFVEGEALAYRLRAGKPDAKAIWSAIGEYNRFFADNEECYTDTRTVAPIAIVLDDRSDGVPLLNGLAARNVAYDVLYERDLSPEKLAPYSAVAVLTAATMRASAISALERFVDRGGKLFAVDGSAMLDEAGRSRPSPAVFARGRRYAELPDMDDLAKDLTGAAPQPWRLVAPSGVLANVCSQSPGGRTRIVVHLLNYSSSPAHGIEVRLPGKFRSARLLTPDKDHPPVRLLPSTEAETRVEVPALGIYSVLILEPSSLQRITSR